MTKANWQVAKANADIGRTAIKQAEAVLQLAEINMNYTKIVSPVDGTIIARRVNIGQTVVSSLNAPSLFLIGKDLSKMQVWAQVNEADIGRIKVGMPVQFSVASLPDEVIVGEVEKVRLNAQSTQNVVLFTVEINFDNSDRKVMPYLTADPVEFVVDRPSDVLMVPNSALSFEPEPEDVAPAVRNELTAVKVDSSATEASPAVAGPSVGRESQKTGAVEENGRPATDSRSGDDRFKAHASEGTVWVKDDEFLRPVKVHVGASDGTETEISGPDVTEGMEVVVAEVHEEHSNSDTKNPFAPQFFRGRRGGRGGAQKGGRGGK